MHLDVVASETKSHSERRVRKTTACKKSTAAAQFRSRRTEEGHCQSAAA